MDNTYWDSDEYDFFDSLDDEDKLLYIYELLSEYEIPEFDDELDDELDDEDEWGDNDDSQNPFSKSKLIISGMDSIRLSGDKIDTITDIAFMIMMNGVILKNSDTKHYDDGSVSLTYKIVGKSNPICLN